MQDGIGQVGAGQNDRRVAGEDLQHYTQQRTADEHPGRSRRIETGYQDGGPVKKMLNEEKARHSEAREMRLQDLERHYKR